MLFKQVAVALASASVAFGASLDPQKVSFRLRNLVVLLLKATLQCYTLSRDGVNYLDSTHNVLKIQNHPE